jgi:hypothetical protein
LSLSNQFSQFCQFVLIDSNSGLNEHLKRHHRNTPISKRRELLDVYEDSHRLPASRGRAACALRPPDRRVELTRWSSRATASYEEHAAQLWQPVKVQTFFRERRYVRYFVVQAEEKEDEEEQQEQEQWQGVRGGRGWRVHSRPSVFLLPHIALSRATPIHQFTHHIHLPSQGEQQQSDEQQESEWQGDYK